jgi:FkbM family methyltransferase
MKQALKIVNRWAFPAVDEWICGHMDANGNYQGEHLVKALSYVSDFKVAIDGGAHVGTWSKPMSLLFQRVLAFEPADDTFAALKQNMEEFGCKNVELYNAALGDKLATGHMEQSRTGEEMHNTGARYLMPVGDIPIMTIDSLKLPWLGFLKLDIEGSELAAMHGGRKTIMRHRPIVLFEDKGNGKNHYGQKRNASSEFLAMLGYHHLERIGGDEIWGPSR